MRSLFTFSCSIARLLMLTLTSVQFLYVQPDVFRFCSYMRSYCPSLRNTAPSSDFMLSHYLAYQRFIKDLITSGIFRLRKGHASSLYLFSSDVPFFCMFPADSDPGHGLELLRGNQLKLRADPSARRCLQRSDAEEHQALHVVRPDDRTHDGVDHGAVLIAVIHDSPGDLPDPAGLDQSKAVRSF